MCTGKEERLIDCSFPENFGSPSDTDAPAQSPSRGLSNALCVDDDGRRFSVVCRRFEINGAGHCLLIHDRLLADLKIRPGAGVHITPVSSDTPADMLCTCCRTD